MPRSRERADEKTYLAEIGGIHGTSCSSLGEIERKLSIEKPEERAYEDRMVVTVHHLCRSGLEARGLRAECHKMVYRERRIDRRRMAVGQDGAPLEQAGKLKDADGDSDGGGRQERGKCGYRASPGGGSDQTIELKCATLR